MKYILMMNGKRSDFEGYAKWSKEDLRANVAFMRTFSKELKDSGVFVSTEGLGWPSEAKLVRAGKNGEPITDGVFPESKEFSRRILDHRRGEPGAGLQDCRAGLKSAGCWGKTREHAHRSAAGAG
jgi:hypothetical protein